MHRMMRCLKASDRYRERLAGRGSPQVADAPPAVISAIPLGSTDGTGQHLSGAITGIEAQTQAQQVADYQGILQYLAPKCYGIRGSRVVTNAQLNSNVFASGGPEATIAATNLPDPKGGNTASFLRETTATGPNWPRIDIAPTGGVTAGDENVFSIDMQSNGRSWAFFLWSDGTIGGSTIWFNLTTGEWGSESVSQGSLLEKKAENLGDGWWRISMRVRMLATAGGVISFGGTTSSNSQPVYTGDGVSGVNFFNLQFYKKQLGIPAEIGPTSTIPITVCYDYLLDGSQLRPFFTFAQTRRYDVFRPTELARSMPFNVGDCIEAVSSDGIRRYYRAISNTGQELIQDPTFSNPTGWVVTGTHVTISVGKVSCVDTQGNEGVRVSLGSSIAAGKQYRLGINVANYALGTVSVSLGEPFPPDTPSASANGWFYNDITYSGADAFFRILTSGSTFSTMDILECSCKEITGALAGQTGATSPVFPPTGTVLDGFIVWEAVGYATIMGLELDDAGSVNHPEGVRFQVGAANILADNQIIALDLFPDVAEARYGFTLTTGPTCNVMFNTDRVMFTVNSQTRGGNIGKLPGRFTRAIARMNTVNAILYNDGGMFTGATGGPIVPSTFTVGDAQGPTFNFTGCILNFAILTNSAMSDANATARSRYDLKPSVGFNADVNAYMSEV